MKYVVVDFEWNQSPYGKNTSNKRLPFEIIEIGAVKIDENGREIGQFSKVIKPKVYKKLHHVTKSLTGITEKELSLGSPFPDALEAFLEWCGDGYMFCTWGNLDLMELQRNMKFYHLEDMLEGPIKYYNVQKLFRIFYDNENSTASLEYAVDFFKLRNKAGFHRAVNDAVYTADVFRKMDWKEAEKWYTVDYFRNPKTRKEELKLIYDTHSKYVSKEFVSKEAAMADREVRTSRCFKCGKPALKRIRWFVGKNKAYYCLAECEEHGYLRGKIRLKKTDEDKIFVVKTLRSIDSDGAGHIADLKEEMRQKRQEKRHREGTHEG